MNTVNKYHGFLFYVMQLFDLISNETRLCTIYKIYFKQTPVCVCAYVYLCVCVSMCVIKNWNFQRQSSFVRTQVKVQQLSGTWVLPDTRHKKYAPHTTKHHHTPPHTTTHHHTPPPHTTTLHHTPPHTTIHHQTPSHTTITMWFVFCLFC